MQQDIRIANLSPVLYRLYNADSSVSQSIIQNELNTLQADEFYYSHIAFLPMDTTTDASSTRCFQRLFAQYGMKNNLR